MSRGDVPDDVIIEVEKLLRAKARTATKRRQLKRSFEALDDSYKLHETGVRLALQAIYDRYGPVTTVSGSISRPNGWTQQKDDEVLLAWLREHRPGVIKETVSEQALKEAGFAWKRDRMVTDTGEVLPGMERVRSEGVSISLVGDGDDDDDDA